MIAEPTRVGSHGGRFMQHGHSGREWKSRRRGGVFLCSEIIAKGELRKTRLVGTVV